MKENYDIVLMGATSFVGQITAWRMAEFYSRSTDIRWAIAGRSQKKLDEVCDFVQKKLGQDIDIPIIIADSMDDSSVMQLCEQTRVVVSTVGPYDQYGELLVKECARSGTHYCDLTGEPNFIFNMLAKYEADAKKSGACIVNCCGFDSLPSDLGAYFLEQKSHELYEEKSVKIEMRVKRMVGTFSGGTIASMMNIIKKAKRDPGLRKALMNPYSLAPSTGGVRQKYVGTVENDAVSGSWMAPFVMASINTKVVLRTAQLLPQLFPNEFYYNEGMLTGKGRKGRSRAKAISRGITMITVGSAFSVTRWILRTFFLPKPGQGPSERQQTEGFYTVHHYGETESGNKLLVEVQGDQDPGYGSTAKMLTQAATALAFDIDENQPGGFWTPASILGDAMLARLPEYAGVTFKVVTPEVT